MKERDYLIDAITMEETVKLYGHIKSFVHRNSRITRGQKKALIELLPKFSLLNREDLEHIPALLLENIWPDTRPLIIEIGCGSGEATIQWCLQNPDKKFLAIDVYLSGIGELLINAEKMKCNNIKTIIIDIIELIKLPTFFQKASGIHIFFPDPWPKKKHKKRRLIQMKFIESITACLQDNGYLYVITDDLDYAEQMYNLFHESSMLYPDVSYVSNRPETKYERRAKKLGNTITEIFFRKKT